MDDTGAPAIPTAWIAIATATHDCLLADLDVLLEADQLDVTAPSRLPG